MSQLEGKESRESDRLLKGLTRRPVLPRLDQRMSWFISRPTVLQSPLFDLREESVSGTGPLGIGTEDFKKQLPHVISRPRHERIGL